MNTAIIILAAGLGTRMRSGTPKVLNSLLGRPLLQYVIDASKKCGVKRIITVTNPGHPEVIDLIKANRIEHTVQKRPLGTADAVKEALRYLDGFRGDLMIVNGDTPLISPRMLKRLITRHAKAKCDLSLISFNAKDPFSYGRIVRDEKGSPIGIVEEKDLKGGLKEIKEVNSGVYIIGSKAAKLISRIKKNSGKGEYYLTDLVSLSGRAGLDVKVFNIGSEEEFFGINSMAELAKAQRLVQDEIIRSFMKKGVMFHDPSSVMVHGDVKIGAGSVIYPGVCIEGSSVIGKDSIIYPGVRIVDSKVGNGTSVLDNSLIEGSVIGEGSSIGPSARLRPGSETGKRVKIGNYVEMKSSKIADGSKASHLSYIGDAIIGKNVNIGAGTITCNYDGRKKHRTVIEDDVFIGSDTQLIAPLKIGKGAFIAAGSTITRDVPRKALAISRSRQKEMRNWKVKSRKGNK